MICHVWCLSFFYKESVHSIKCTVLSRIWTSFIIVLFLFQAIPTYWNHTPCPTSFCQRMVNRKASHSRRTKAESRNRMRDCTFLNCYVNYGDQRQLAFRSQSRPSCPKRTWRWEGNWKKTLISGSTWWRRHSPIWTMIYCRLFCSVFPIPTEKWPSITAQRSKWYHWPIKRQPIWRHRMSWIRATWFNWHAMNRTLRDRSHENWPKSWTLPVK